MSGKNTEKIPYGFMRHEKYDIVVKYIKNTMEEEWKNIRRFIAREAINIKNYDEAAFKIIGMEALHIVCFFEKCDEKNF